MDLNAVRMLAKVAESRSFTLAAASLGITQSGLSRAIGRLEDELGVRLLYRTTRSVSLTPDGQVFYDRCAPLLLEFDAAEKLLVDRRSAPSGPLKVTMPLALGRIVFMPAIAALTSRYPDLTLDVSMTDRVVDLTDEGYDAAVRTGTIQDARIVARPLGTVHWATVASPAYLKRYGTPRSLEDLERHNCLVAQCPRTGRAAEWEFHRDGQSHRLAVHGSMRLDVEEALAEAAALNYGIAQVPAFMVEDAVQRGALVPLLPAFAGRSTPVSLVYPPSRQCSLKIGALVKALLEACASHGSLQGMDAASAEPRRKRA